MNIRYLTIIIWLCGFSIISTAQVMDLVLDQSESGNQTHQARRTITFNNGYYYTPNGGTMLAEIIDPIIAGETEFASAIYAPTYTINTSLEVGKTPGQLQVSGSANYTVPIETPKGINGLQPSINLNYSSNFNDGPMGIGWNISGLSAISRVIRNIYYDGAANPIEGNLNDRYAIDGKRMIVTNGYVYGSDNSEYGTELEDFSKIIAHGSTGEGPSYFEVKMKSGLIYEYGNTVDSKIIREGDCILSWKLNKITDRFGNTISFTYFHYDDEHPIHLIEYNTGNTAKINFRYKERDNESTYCYGGKEFTRDILLDRIEIENNGQIYKTYHLEYIKDSYAQLQKITESGTGGDSYNPTVFTWTDQTETFFNTTHFSSSETLRFYHGDFNGDGRTDFVTVPAKDEFATTDKLKLYLATDNGMILITSIDFYQDDFNQFTVADFNGDGMDDLMSIRQRIINDRPYIDCQPYISTGNSFDAGSYTYISEEYFDRFTIVDYDGDGKLEILFYSPSEYSLWTYTEERIFNHEGFSFGNPAEFYVGSGFTQICDFNGDGCSDILSQFDNSSKLFEFKGAGKKLTTTKSNININNTNLLRLGDFNGDGTTDIIKISGPINPSWTLFSYNKDGFHENSISGFSGFNLDQTNNRSNACDINADGKADLIIWGKGENTSNNPNRINVAINQGNGIDYEITEYSSPIDFKIGFKSDTTIWEDFYKTTYFYFGDYSGDGRMEFFYKDEASTSKKFSFAVGTPSHLINNIIDGLGVQTEITYRPMSDNDVYTKGTGATYPLCDFSSAMQLVSQIDSDNGIGGTASISYEYEGAKYHHRGKGFIGFIKSIENHLYNGNTITTTNEVNTSRYYTRPTSIVTKYGTTTIDAVSYTWDEIGLSYNRVFPYVEEKTNFDGLKDLSNTTTSAYNSYGNPTSIEVDYGDGHTYTTTYAYNSENTSSSTWLIGRPTTITESWEKDSETDTYVTTRTYIAGTNAPDIDQYNSGNQAYWKLDRGYDSYGNLNQEKKITTGLSDLTTTYSYNSGLRLENITDPTGAEIDFTYYPTSGLLESKTDDFGNEIWYAYNGIGQLTSETPDNGITKTVTRSFDVSGGPSYSRYYVQVAGDDGSAQKVWYDFLGREIRTETKSFSGTMVKVDKKYNSKGQLYTVSEPSTSTPDKWNVTSFDNFGRTTTLNPYYGATKTFDFFTSYGLEAITEATINGLDYVTIEDAAGLITERQDPAGNIIYCYSPNGTLKSTNTPGNVTTTMTYDRNRNRLTLNDPSAGTITNTYYGTGQVKTELSENNSTTYTYQTNGLLDKYVDDEGETNYSYNSDNLVSSITSPGGVTRSYTYDTEGRVATITESIGSVSNVVTFNYDSLGRLYRKYFNGSTDYEQYDYSNGYLYRIKFNGSTVWQLSSMDEYGRITQATIGSNTCSWSFDSNKMLSQIYSSGVMDYDYSFNVNTGNLNSRENDLKNLDESFGYDNTTLNELVSVTGPPNITCTYTSSGNISYKSDAGTFAYNHSSGNPFAVSGITNAQNISSTTQDIDYYSFEKVKKITEGTKTADFWYNADHQRIKMELKTSGSTTKTKYYFGGSCEREVVGSTTTQYIWIGGDAYTAVAVAKKVGTGAWTIYNIFRDHLGTITHLKTGSTINEYSFDAWGRRRDKDTWSYSLSDEPALFAERGFTAHEHLEDFKLNNMNGRLYDPVVGRFLSPDPYVQDPANSQSFNRYSYCLNNPLKYNDPSGNSFVGNLFKVFLGNYLINVGDNWINKDMPIKEAFKNTPIIAGVNFSPSDLSFSHPAIYPKDVAKREEKLSEELDEVIASQKGRVSSSNGIPDWVLTAYMTTRPVAYSIEGTGATEVGIAGSMSPWGGILITRGPDKWTYKNFTSTGLGYGWFSASAMAVGYKYYYTGNINNFRMELFEGWGNNLSLSADVGPAVGINVSWVMNPNAKGEFLIGVGAGVGIGVGSPVSGQYTRQYNHIYW